MKRQVDRHGAAKECDYKSPMTSTKGGGKLAAFSKQKSGLAGKIQQLKGGKR